MTKLIAALATTALVSMGSMAFAQEDKSGTNTAPSMEAEAGAVSQIAMAQDLYEYGVAAGDALSVLAAARIAASVELTDSDFTPTQEAKEGADTTEDGEGVDAPISAEDMMATAKELAAGDPALESLVEDAMAAGSRGRIGGASKTLSRLPAGYRDIFEIPFYGGRYAEIAIVGDGDANLDALVTDENGNAICVDTSYSDKLYCSFTPAWDGYFYVVVDNVGRVRNSYYLVTN